MIDLVLGASHIHSNATCVVCPHAILFNPSQPYVIYSFCLFSCYMFDIGNCKSSTPDAPATQAQQPCMDKTGLPPQQTPHDLLKFDTPVATCKRRCGSLKQMLCCSSLMWVGSTPQYVVLNTCFQLLGVYSKEQQDPIAGHWSRCSK